MIVMEYASKGELYDYISERRRLSERETRHFFRQIVSAVHHCHKVRKTKLKSLPTYFAAPLSDPFASLAHGRHPLSGLKRTYFNINHARFAVSLIAG